ncbi:MAG: iron-sulfur cluster assembly scaffold protein [Candidatus Aminicenantes bacterium]|nr:iron-sulfur cluster assembly scaffold protein [Candidatus Aminicenantes bacterium]
MKSTSYSDKVLDHFRNPRNVGDLKGKDIAKGSVGNPVCGDLMEFSLKVKDNRIQDIKFKTFGCGSAVATASMITELAKGKTLDEALKITRKDVADELDGLPPVKMHCSNLAADALRDAINNYKEKQKTKDEPEKSSTKPHSEHITGEKEFSGKGVYHAVKDPSSLKDQRVLIQDRGKKSIQMAETIAEHSPRVVLVTKEKSQKVKKTIQTELRKSGVKILFESELKEISGLNSVEKVKIHDLDEDNIYELFVDAVVLI